jgi:glycosyltransferase involved in cell wall biosynthesis
MKLIIEKSVVVVTPTIGSPKLADAIESVQRQTYGNLEHLVVVDGYDYENDTNKAFRSAWQRFPEGSLKSARVMIVPWNTGGTGGKFYGHRIYAGVPHFINADYIFYLDEDNWYEQDHVKSLVEVLDQGYDFAHSFRKIYSSDKKYIADDNCEALGRWPIYFTHNDPQYLVDTSSFAFNTKFLQKTCHFWHSGWGGDRRYLYSVLAQNPKWNSNYKHTLCYRTDSNPNSPDADFFIKGNEEQLKHYNGELPWLI